MANPEVAYEHTGTGAPTALAAPITDTDLSFTVLDGSGHPTGAGGSFWMTIDRGTAQYERILCSGRVGNVFTVQASGGRGADGTVARDHAISAVVEHTWSAVEATQLSQHVSKTKDIHGVTSDVVGVDDAQTLQNKTLITPTIASLVNAQHDHSNAANGGVVPVGGVTGLQATLDGLAATDVSLAADIALRQLLSEKGAANGYAGLDAGGLVLFSDLPVGTAASTVAEGDHEHASEAYAATTLTSHLLLDGDPGPKNLDQTTALGVGKYLILATCEGFTLGAGGTVTRLRWNLSQSGGTATLRGKPITTNSDTAVLNGGAAIHGWLEVTAAGTQVAFTVEKLGGAQATTDTNGMLVAIKVSN